MVVQRHVFLLLLMLITDAAALFYFLKDHKHQHSHEEVDHHNYHQGEYKPHEHKNHKYEGHKHHEEHKQEHKHHEHKPQHTMHKYHDHDHHYYHHGYDHKQHEQKHHEQYRYHDHEHHDHHENKHHDLKHHDHYDHKHQEHKHHDHHDHKHQEHKHHDHHDHKHHDSKYHEHKHHEHYQEHKHQGQLHYEFKYGVRDPNTGDIKNQWEVRKGDDVLGEYSLVEADGTIRTVQYTAGKHTGFNAIVKKEGKAKHPIVEGHKSFGSIQSLTPSYSSVKPVFVEPTHDAYEAKTKTSVEIDNPRLHYFAPPELPPNHKPVFSGIDEETNLLALYKHYPVHNIYRTEETGFDYGINEYLSKRSYDLSKISKILNESVHSAPTVDPIRAARGSFVMGR